MSQQARSWLRSACIPAVIDERRDGIKTRTGESGM
jgi:hypothetical protein